MYVYCRYINGISTYEKSHWTSWNTFLLIPQLECFVPFGDMYIKIPETRGKSLTKVEEMYEEVKK